MMFRTHDYLADAIMSGFAMGIEHIRGRLFRYGNPYQRITGACVIGAGAIGAGIIDPANTSLYGDECVLDDLRSMYRALEWPISKPGEEVETLGAALIDRNDSLLWSKEEIHWWLIEYEKEFAFTESMVVSF